MRMKQMMFRISAIVFSLLLLVGNLSFIQPQVAQAASLEDKVTVIAMDDAGETILPLTAVKIKAGDTAFDALERAGNKQDIEITTDDNADGKYINAIGDVKSVDSYDWSFILKGTESPVDASAYKAANGDHFYFALHDNDEAKVTGKVSVTDINGTAVIPETKVSVVEGATAYDALLQAAVQNNVKVNASVDDRLFMLINNIGKANISESTYWDMAINDMPLTISIVEHQLKKGEHLKLTVQTDNSGDDEISDKEEAAEPHVKGESGKNPVQQKTKTTLPNITNKLVQTHINDVKNYIAANDITFLQGSEWWVWGATNTGIKVPADYETSVEDRLKELEGEFRNIYELERMIIGLSAVRKDATDIAGFNLLDILAQHEAIQGEKPLINALIYGLLAVDSGQYKVSKAFKKKLIAGIVADEVPSGGWAFFGDTVSPDITGMALSALAPYKDNPEVKVTIDRAVAYLSAEQDQTGGYDISWNGGDSSESVSQAIIGLASVGVDPTGDQFTKDGGNLLQHLLKFNREDGGFTHIIDDKDAQPMSTEQALLALAAYQKFKNGSGLVYQFPFEADGDDDQKVPTPEKPALENPDPENPSKDQTSEGKTDPLVPKTETDVDKEKHEMTISVKARDIKDARDKQLMLIKPDNAIGHDVLNIQLANDALKALVDGNHDLKIDKGDTSLLIPTIILKHLLQEAGDQSVTINFIKQQADKQLGAVYDYSIHAGDKVMKDFNGNNMILTLNVKNDVVKDFTQDEIKMFYFNDEAGNWEVQKDSAYDLQTGIVTANVSRLGKYGVFKNEQHKDITTPLPSKRDYITDQTTNKNGSKLPNTATSMYNFMAVGLLFIVIGAVLFIVKRRRITKA